MFEIFTEPVVKYLNSCRGYFYNIYNPIQSNPHGPALTHLMCLHNRSIGMIAMKGQSVLEEKQTPLPQAALHAEKKLVPASRPMTVQASFDRNELKC